MTDWVQKQMERIRKEEAGHEEKGGPGSGHHGHAGRPGFVGGSLPGTAGGEMMRQALDATSTSDYYYIRARDLAQSITQVIRDLGDGDVEGAISAIPEHWDIIRYSAFGFELRMEDLVAMRNPVFRRYVEGLIEGEIFSEYAEGSGVDQ